jgi:hypothetical protein
MSDLKQIVLQRKAQAQTHKPKKTRRKSGRRKQTLKDRKIKNTILKTRQRLEAQDLELNAPPKTTLQQRKELNKIRKQSIEEAHLKAMYERGQDQDTDANEQKKLIIELIKPESEKGSPVKPSSPYDTSNITKEQSNKMLANARNFNELQRIQYQQKRNAVQAELAEMGDYQKMFDADEMANAQAGREAELYPVYPPLVYGKEANNLFRSKFIDPTFERRSTPERRRPAPSVRRGPRPNAPKRNPRPVTRKVAAPAAAPAAPAAPTVAPEVPVLRKMPTAPKPQQSRRRRS